MRRPLVLVVILSLLLVASSGLVHLSRLSRAQTEETASSCCGQTDTTAPRQLEFPHYSLRDGFNSTLLLVSASPKPLDFVVAIHSRSGQTLLAPTMTI